MFIAYTISTMKTLSSESIIINQKFSVLIFNYGGVQTPTHPLYTLGHAPGTTSPLTTLLLKSILSCIAF